MRGILREMQALDGTTAQVTTEHRTLYTFESRGARPYDPTGATGRADGGYISGPGGPREDLIPARLSNGEYVIQAAAVQRYGREMFDRLNAMQFANGGYVSPVPVSQRSSVSVSAAPVSANVSLSTADVNRIANAVREGARRGSQRGSLEGTSQGMSGIRDHQNMMARAGLALSRLG